MAQEYDYCWLCFARVPKGRLDRHLERKHSLIPSETARQPVLPETATRAKPNNEGTKSSQQPKNTPKVPNPFRDRQLRDWFCQSVDPTTIGLNVVSSTGSGPFKEAEFDKFLLRSGIQLETISADTKVLVVGYRDWSETVLRSLIRSRSGKKLRVYSQEMLIAFLVSGNDPLTSSSNIVERWGRGHLALTFLSDVVGFDWPTTAVLGGGGTELQADWLQLGYLRYLGYAVGRSGKVEDERHEILTKAYRAQRLPDIFPADYRREWGGPHSALRLHKMADSIASFCRNGRRRPHAMNLAISEWEADLEWLRVTYYEGRYQFEWPSAQVW